MNLKFAEHRVLTWVKKINGESFKLVFCLSTKIQVFKLIYLDACGRPLFANPVTYLVEENSRMSNLMQIKVSESVSA